MKGLTSIEKFAALKERAIELGKDFSSAIAELEHEKSDNIWLSLTKSLGALEELHSEIFDSIGLELQEKEAVRAQTKAFNLEVIARLDRMRRVLEHL